MLNSLKLLLGAAGLVQGAGDAGGEDKAHAWTYVQNGADWPAVFPGCGNTTQSPIDLPNPWKSKDADLPIYENSEFDYEKGYSNVKQAQVEWNGHTVQTDLPAGAP